MSQGEADKSKLENRRRHSPILRHLSNEVLTETDAKRQDNLEVESRRGSSHLLPLKSADPEYLLLHANNTLSASEANPSLFWTLQGLEIDKREKNLVDNNNKENIKLHSKKENINQENMNQNKLNQDKLNQNKMNQDKLNQNKMNQDKTNQNKLNQDKLNQDKLNQDKLNQELNKTN